MNPGLVPQTEMNAALFTRYTQTVETFLNFFMRYFYILHGRDNLS